MKKIAYTLVAACTISCVKDPSSTSHQSPTDSSAVNAYARNTIPIPVCSPDSRDPRANWSAAGFAVAAAALAYDMYTNRLDQEKNFKQIDDSDLNYHYITSFSGSLDSKRSKIGKRIDPTKTVEHFEALPPDIQSDLVNKITKYHPEANWAAANVAVAVAHLAYNMYKNKVANESKSRSSTPYLIMPTMTAKAQNLV